MPPVKAGNATELEHSVATHTASRLAKGWLRRDNNMRPMDRRAPCPRERALMGTKRYNHCSVIPSLSPVSSKRRTTLLVILDGFGHRTATEDNAIRAAQTPNSTGYGAMRPTHLSQAQASMLACPKGRWVIRKNI